MSKKKRWLGVSPQERGKEAEEKFFKAWSNPKNLDTWMVSIERPTIHEDLFQKTDAVIVRISGPRLRIQIKSYWLTDEERVVLLKYGVVPISIASGDSLKQIRKKTYLALKNYDLFIAQDEKVKHSDYKELPKSIGFYKKGKKHYK